MAVRPSFTSCTLLCLTLSLACTAASKQGAGVVPAQAPPPTPSSVTTQASPRSVTRGNDAVPRQPPPPTAPDGIEIVPIKGGCFTMGSAVPTGGPEERPAHEVCLNDFYIGRTEITREHWLEFMGSLPPTSNAACGDACPAEFVSWDDAQAFLRAVNGNSVASGREYRLPTEAEWEYAARSGGMDELYSGEGTDVDSLAWHFWNGGVTREVGRLAANGLGLHDMSGNVWEWTSDWYDESYYASSPRLNPKGPASGKERILRGGSAACPPFDLRATYRNHLPPEYRGPGKGFRVVMTVVTPAP